MKLSTVFQQLTHGELSQLDIGGAENAGIQVCDYVKVVGHINLALTELYTRFPLKVAEVIVQQYDHIQTYYLDSKFAKTNSESDEPVKYIMDSQFQPFLDNVNKIEQVFNEEGVPLLLNDFDGCCSHTPASGMDHQVYHPVYTPTYNSIQVPQPEKENNMIITYRADHDPILVPGLDPSTTEVAIPPGYLQALLLFVGSRVYAGMNADQGNEGNTYYQKFEAACAKLTELNLMNRDTKHNSKLDCAGWV